MNTQKTVGEEAEIKIVPQWRETLRSMEVGQFINVEYKQEYYMRHLASLMKEENKEYSVNRTDTGIKVTRTL